MDTQGNHGGQDESIHQVRTDACVALLLELLQREEQRHPGTLDQAIEDTLADHAAIDPDVPGKAHIDRIVDEKLRIVRLANDMMKIPWEPLRKA